MNKLLIILLFSFGLLGCVKSEQQKMQEKRDRLDLQVQKLVRNKLKDESAKFRNQWDLCGEVNTKNSLGAYTGFQRFLMSGEYIYFENDYKSDQTSMSAFNEAWDSECKK